MGNTTPLYRRLKPEPQLESDFLRDISLNDIGNRFVGLGKLKPYKRPISVKTLIPSFFSDVESDFIPKPPYSLRQILRRLLTIGGYNPHIDLTHAHMDPFGVIDPVKIANRLFDKRAAAAVYAAVYPKRGVRVFPSVKKIDDEPYHLDDDTGTHPKDPGDHLFSDIDLLEMKYYEDEAPTIFIPTGKCLAVLAYFDYFPGSSQIDWLTEVSQAILASSPGWCGTYGPGVHGTIDFIGQLFSPLLEGNYDMSQMHLLQIAYRYYDRLHPNVLEFLITELLARGTINLINEDDMFTSGGAPVDWSRAGYLAPFGKHIRLGETENHILTILTARYLTNQLLYQRKNELTYDNRRNGFDIIHGKLVKKRPHCTELVLALMRNILRDDFSEYNAKNYQIETRSALLNLCSYAYDHEVRLAARMVLDYISAHIAVSSNDLRRMVPFRRRNEGKNVDTIPSQFARPGFMDTGLLEEPRGADPMAEVFAIQTGSTRAYEDPYVDYSDHRRTDRPLSWSIATSGGDAVIEALSDYRIPAPILDLFVHDRHRRFFQRLHRTPQDNVDVTGRNCDNYEIYASSPSYLISAGGSPATYAIDPHVFGIVPPGQDQQLGVAVTTTFMPTGQSAGANTQNQARDLIQFSSFFPAQAGGAFNYGVAPDFACGHIMHMPDWCKQALDPQTIGKFSFVNKKGEAGRPGFFLAFLIDGDFTVMEALDTWLYPKVTFDQFKTGVADWNKDLNDRGLHNNVEDQYQTQNGNILRFTIFNLDVYGGEVVIGAVISKIEYGDREPMDAAGDAGNISGPFLNGTILNSAGDGVVEITNFFLPDANNHLGAKIILDMQDQRYPRRTSETGEVEEAGHNQEVWVDFAWTGECEGDFFHPFNTLAAAVIGVADHGVIKIMPGSTTERFVLTNNKRIKLVAPIGGVNIGVR